MRTHWREIDNANNLNTLKIAVFFLQKYLLQISNYKRTFFSSFDNVVKCGLVSFSFSHFLLFVSLQND